MSNSLNPDAHHDYTMDYDLLDSLSIILLLISVSKAHALLQQFECYYMYYLNYMHNEMVYTVLYKTNTYGIFILYCIVFIDPMVFFWLPLLDIHVYIQFTLTHMVPLLTGHRPSQTAPPNQ